MNIYVLSNLCVCVCERERERGREIILLQWKEKDIFYGTVYLDIICSSFATQPLEFE